jgi:hypothetical protein
MFDPFFFCALKIIEDDTAQSILPSALARSWHSFKPGTKNTAPRCARPASSLAAWPPEFQTPISARIA